MNAAGFGGFLPHSRARTFGVCYRYFLSYLLTIKFIRDSRATLVSDRDILLDKTRYTTCIHINTLFTKVTSCVLPDLTKKILRVSRRFVLLTLNPTPFLLRYGTWSWKFPLYWTTCATSIPGSFSSADRTFLV